MATLTIEDGITQMAAQEAPLHKPHYTLEELLAQCDTDSPLSPEDRAWLDAPAVGREAL
jgi:antitoxin ChpS